MLTKQQQDEYIDNPYHCPFCKSEDIYAVEDNISRKVVKCKKCNGAWIAKKKLTKKQVDMILKIK